MMDELQEAPQAEEDNAINQDAISDDYDIQENDDGSATLIPKETEEPDGGESSDFHENLVETILKDQSGQLLLSKLSAEYLEYIEIDKETREKRDKQYADAIKRSGLGEAAPGGAEFDGANKVTHPLLSEATVDFAARAIKELFPPNGPVKTKILGKATPAKYRKAERKARHMNWQCTKQMPEFRSCLEQILTQAALSGVQYSKTYHWKRGRRSKFEYVPMDDVYVPFHAANFYSATRKTHAQRLNQIEFEERVSSGLYYDWEINDFSDSYVVDESESKRASDKVEGKEEPVYDSDGLRTVYEVYCWLELDADTLAQGDYKYAPYIMTIDNPTNRVLSIYRNWDKEDPSMNALDWIIEWPFVPWRGAYAIGLSHLIGGLSGAATGALRALLDSAHINNSQTALKLKGSQIGGQSISINIGEVSEIDGAPGIDDIRKIAMPLPFNPPSPMLFQLLGLITEYGKGVVRTVIEKSTEYSPNTPPGTEMSHVDQGLTVYASIHARLHGAMERQLCIQHRLNAMYLEDNDAAEELPYGENEEHAGDLDDETSTPLAFKSDYEGEMDVEPVSDPNISSEVQRFSQMAGVGQLVNQAPQIYNLRAYHKAMLQLMKIPPAKIEEFLPEPPTPQDENPATENIKMAFGQPAFVLPDQDHLAHLQVLMDFMNDPFYGKNPAIRPKFLSHAVDHAVQHMLFLYGNEIKTLIEKAAGQPVKNLLGDEPELKELMSKTVAATSPLALKNTAGLLEKILPILSEAIQEVQQMQPPAPMDPSAAALQIKQVDAQIAQQRDQANLKATNIKVQADAQKTQAKIQSDQQSDQTKAIADAQQLQEKITSDQQIAKLHSDTELEKNEEDNQTALTITAMRAATGEKTGNLSNGNSIGEGEL